MTSLAASVLPMVEVRGLVLSREILEQWRCRHSWEGCWQIQEIDESLCWYTMLSQKQMMPLYLGISLQNNSRTGLHQSLSNSLTFLINYSNIKILAWKPLPYMGDWWLSTSRRKKRTATSKINCAWAARILPLLPAATRGSRLSKTPSIQWCQSWLDRMGQ